MNRFWVWLFLALDRIGGEPLKRGGVAPVNWLMMKVLARVAWSTPLGGFTVIRRPGRWWDPIRIYRS